MVQLTINNIKYSLDIDDETPLLWVLREELKLKGTKFGCGKGLCGACTVLVGETATRSCILPASLAAKTPITTIEGLNTFNPKSSQHEVSAPLQELKEELSITPNLHPVQQAWLLEDVVQCGYCQPGQILTAVALLKNIPNPSDDQIAQAMSLNLCRCGTYPRIRKAIKKAVELINMTQKETP